MSNKINEYIELCKKAYYKCSSKFHDYYAEQFKFNAYSLINNQNEIHVKLDFHNMINKNNYDSFNKFIDDAVFYKLELQTKLPDKCAISYLFDNIVVSEMDLDKILEEIIGYAFPKELAYVLKQNLEIYINNENVRNVFINKFIY